MDDFIIEANIKLIELQLRLSEPGSREEREYGPIADEYVRLKTRGYEELGYNFLSEEQSMAVLRVIGQCENKLRLIKKTLEARNMTGSAN